MACEVLEVRIIVKNEETGFDDFGQLLDPNDASLNVPPRVRDINHRASRKWGALIANPETAGTGAALS